MNFMEKFANPQTVNLPRPTGQTMLSTCVSEPGDHLNKFKIYPFVGRGSVFIAFLSKIDNFYE